MQPFLYTVASALSERFAGRTHELAVVFPNRRQSVFFSHYFQQVAKSQSFMPELLTIEELVKTSSDLHVADNLTQGFALYEAFVEVAKQAGDAPFEIPAFDVFFSIGETILKDFAEIDSYLVNIHDVCKVLYDIEAIDKAFDQLTEEQKEFLQSFWKGTTDKGRVQEKFLKLWLRLPAIYTRFQELLAEKELTTMGMLYRQLAMGTASNTIYKQQWQHIAFVGFNAFNKSEETFIKQWNDEGFASLWFDADAWYVQRKEQEAGFFLRRNLNIIELKNELPLLDVIGSRETAIEITGADGQHAQAKLVAPWYAQYAASVQPMQLGILLADESLLVPVLQSIPESMGKINITVGYSLQQSQVYSLMNLFFEVQQDLLKHRYQTVHHELVIQWLQHAYCGWPVDAKEKLQQKMLKDNLVRVPVNLLTQHVESSVLMFSRMMADMELFQRLRQIIELALNNTATNTDSIDQGLCVAAWKTLQQLEPLFAKLPASPGLGFIGSLLMKQLGSITVPFEGEPLHGVQLMGLLESRGLDFDHILVVGASEGSLPRIKPPDSFLPDNVRRAFGLPVPEHQDAIFAYVFYRLLHRASSVQLVYNALVTDNSTGEESRFVKQLAFETKIPIVKKQWSQPVFPESWPAITIQKDEEILKRLWLYYAKDTPISVSPSALNTYLNCRLSFFFKYIAKLKEPDQLEEGVDAAAVGNVLHKLMEMLYQAALLAHGKTITTAVVDWMKAQTELMVESAFKKGWRSKEIEGPFEFSGELHVVRAIVLQYAEALLNMDAAYAPFNLEHLEVPLYQKFGFNLNGKVESVFLKGFVDRIDENDGLYRMVDYKTGSDSPEFFNIDALFEQEGKKQNKAALQTLIYSWMFKKAYPDLKRVEPALLAIRHLQKNEGSVQLWNTENKSPIDADAMPDTLHQVEEKLRKLLEEIFDPAVDFDQTTDPNNCGYCDFKGICGR
ncbi:MAG TPA: PD-(D/E)XK nuclease family protein [Phnomibacter sp.]|nr:PD-(D/E)XK nuclease family protein [Phnomibacter sp.]